MKAIGTTLGSSTSLQIKKKRSTGDEVNYFLKETLL